MDDAFREKEKWVAGAMGLRLVGYCIPSFARHYMEEYQSICDKTKGIPCRYATWSC
jgi:hypothetical protein